VPCKSPCETCYSEFECASCTEGNYKLLNSNSCKSNCNFGSYQDTKLRECLPCLEGCIGCFGPSLKDCEKCNYEKGYSNKIDSTECEKLACEDGKYLKIDLAFQKAFCDSCYKTCKTCANGNPNGCLSCKNGLKPFNKVIINSTTNEQISLEIFECNNCETFMKGYFTYFDGSCKGILIFV